MFCEILYFTILYNIELNQLFNKKKILVSSKIPVLKKTKDTQHTDIKTQIRFCIKKCQIYYCIKIKFLKYLLFI